LITTLNYLLILKVILGSFLPLFDIKYYFIWLRRWYYSKKDEKEIKLTQEELNYVYEDYKFKMMESTTELIMIVFITMSYSYLMPYCPLFAIVGIIMRYWIQKWVILKRCQVPF